MAKVRIVDVAREAGVSLGTVSNALNHPEKVRPDTRRLIQEAIERLGYTPNQSARMLAGGRNATIGLVLPRLNHGPSLQIANGAHTEARRHGFDLLIANADRHIAGIELISMDGRVVASAAGNVLNVSEVANGVYIAKVYVTDGFSTKQVIVRH